MVEALVVVGLVVAFLAVAGVAGLTVYRLWTTSEDKTGGSGVGDGSAADVRES